LEAIEKMAILQIIPAHPGDRIAWYGDDAIRYVTPTCLALVKEGDKTRIAYMEMVDDEIVEVDTEDEAFLGFYNTTTQDNSDIITTYESRKKAHGKSK